MGAEVLQNVYYYCCFLVAQSCLILFSGMDYSPPGSCVHGTFQARILEWVAISFSRGSSQLGDPTCISCMDRWIFFFFLITEPPGNPSIHLRLAFKTYPSSYICFFLFQDLLPPNTLFLLQIATLNDVTTCKHINVSTQWCPPLPSSLSFSSQLTYWKECPIFTLLNWFTQ